MLSIFSLQNNLIYRENIPHKDYSKDMLSAEAEKLIEGKHSYLYRNKQFFISLAAAKGYYKEL